jgi:ABC-type transport system involved in multi-copper enzyme maturation permease subunit
MNFRGAMSVFRFECRRTLTSARVLFAALMAAFPAALAMLIQTLDPRFGVADHWKALLAFILGTCVLGVFGSLLWATPVIAAELEGGTWIYLATRPVGKTSVLLGKYAAAVVWTFCVCAAAVTASVVLSNPPENVTRLLGVLFALSAIGSLTYGAIFAFIGVMSSKKAMVSAVLYVLFVEAATLQMPGAMKMLSVNFHLRCLLKNWMGWSFPYDVEEAWFDTASSAEHLLMPVIAVVGLLTAAGLVLRQRELAAAGDARAT